MAATLFDLFVVSPYVAQASLKYNPPVLASWITSVLELHMYTIMSSL